MPTPEPSRPDRRDQFPRIDPRLVRGNFPETFTETEKEKILKFCHGVPGGPGANIYDLERLLRAVPQEKDGELRYLVSGGFAVELATRSVREHKDIDLVFLTELNTTSVWYNFGRIDTVVPEEYFAHMNLSSSLLAASARGVYTRQGEDGVEAFIVHPALVLVQKTSSFYDKAPRAKDLEDARQLIRLASVECAKPELRGEWKNLVAEGIESLTTRKRPITRNTLEGVLVAAGSSKRLRDLLLGDAGPDRFPGLDGSLPPFPRFD